MRGSSGAPACKMGPSVAAPVPRPPFVPTCRNPSIVSPLAAAVRPLAAALLGGSACVAAHAEPVATRAGFLDSPAVVGLGRWQYDPVFPLPELHAPAVSRFASRLAALDVPLRGQAMQLRAAAGNAA